MNPLPSQPETAPKRGRLSLRKRFAFSALLALLVVVTCLGLGEIVCRLAGRRPYKPLELVIAVEPGGRFFRPHPTLGYQQLPGEFQVTLQGEYTWRAKHLANTLRVCRREKPQTPMVPRKALWLFGCSFTYGWAVNDEDSYPWLVQEALPGSEVQNFGVCGYSNVQSLLQFKEALAQQEQPPTVVVLAYASFHDQRNTYLRRHQKDTAPFWKLGLQPQPFARLDGESLRFGTASLAYTELPLMRTSALIHTFDNIYIRLEAGAMKSSEVSQAVIEQFQLLCTDHNIQFILAGIYQDPATEKMLETCEKKGIAAVNLAVNLAEPGMSNIPYDGHPGARAHRLYAEKLLDYFTRQKALR